MSNTPQPEWMSEVERAIYEGKYDAAPTEAAKDQRIAELERMVVMLKKDIAEAEHDRDEAQRRRDVALDRVRVLEMADKNWATIPSQWPKVFERAAARITAEQIAITQKGANSEPGEFVPYPGPLVAPLTMSDRMEVGPHDFDEHLRICKRCGASTQEWVDGKVECGTGDLDLTGWEGATPQEKHDRRARNIAQAAARQERGKTAAADDFAFINRKLGENEKADKAARVGSAPVFWLPSRTHEEDVTNPFLTGTGNTDMGLAASFGRGKGNEKSK